MPQDELTGLTLDRSQISDRQDSLLPEIVAFAYEHSSLVRATWQRAGVSPADVRSRDDFVERAPFLDADAVRDAADGQRDPFREALCVPIHDLTVIGTTSGTTGLPQALPQRRGDIRSHSSLREYVTNGVTAGSRVLVTGPASRSGHGVDKFEKLGAVPIYLDGTQSSAAHLVDVARSFGPTHWWLMTGPLLFALQQYEEQSGDDLGAAFSTLGPTVWGGEPLSSANRATIERWGLSTRLMTSLGNMCAAVECPAQAGSHVWEDLVFAECLDVESGEPVADGGRGELVVTPLIDRAGPILRYRSGDLVELTQKQCECGLHHGRIRTIGRLVDRVQIGDRTVLPADIWNVVDQIPSTAAGVFQIVRSRSGDNRLFVRVGYAPNLVARPAALGADLERRLFEAIGVECELEMSTADELLANRGGVKLRRVVE